MTEHAPMPMGLLCPSCGAQHLDIAEPDGIDWSKRPHKTHLCKNTPAGPATGCGHEWRPFEFATVGVFREHDRLLQIMPRRPEDYRPWGDVERWKDPHQNYGDCSSGCRFSRPLEGEIGADWVVCTNTKSHRVGLLTFEHQGCRQFEHEPEEETTR